MNGHTQQSQPDDIAAFIYHRGFLSANFADTQLVLHNSPSPFPPYNLHALIVARSPRLFDQLKRAAGPPYHLHLEASDPNLTVEGMNLVLGSLYNGRKEVPRSLAMGVLAASNALQLEEIGRVAWDACHKYFTTPEGLQEGIRFALSTPWSDSPNGTGGGAGAGGTGIGAGAGTPLEGPYPQFTKHLITDLLKFLAASIASPTSEQILLSLPFPLLKSVLESEDVKMSSMERHNFARTIVMKRRKVQEPGVEESVVMAFGTDSRSGGIEVLRKDRSSRKKALWKAGSNGR